MSAPGVPGFERKIVAAGKLVELAAVLPRPLVFTNGVFDILHRGHVTYLAEARSLGASLVVALNSDNSVRRLAKGADRPVNPLADRSALIAALESASLVCSFDEDTPLSLVVALRPDVLVKGGDWPVAEIVGAREMATWGGVVRSIPFRFERSTTDLIERIRAHR